MVCDDPLYEENKGLVHCGTGYTTPSPPSDGKMVFAHTGKGVVAGFTLDGQRQWIKIVEKPSTHYGQGPSPVCAEGKVLMLINTTLYGLDPATGQTLWKQTTIGTPQVGSPCRHFRDGHCCGNPRGNGTFGTPRRRSEVTIPTPQPDPLPLDKNGKPVASEKASLKPMTCAAGRVFLHTYSYQARAADSAITALDAKTGKQLWRFALPGRKWTATDSSSCILYRDGELLYIGGHGSGGIARFDPETGAQKGEFKVGIGHYAYAGECSMSRGTSDWLIKAALTWYDKDLNANLRLANRSTCGTGVFPAQGMVFSTPIGCDCTDYARGYQGLSCEPPLPVVDEQRLTSGPGKPGNSLPVAGDWPMFMADAGRSLRSTVALPAELAVRWTVAGAPRPMAGVLLDDRRRDEYWIGALTAPVIAGGTVYAGLPEAHAVTAHDATTGKLLWRTPLGGPVDTPPTIAGGLCVFGCQDGAIYALSTADGALVWRFDGAPGRRLAMLNGRLASAFPAPGGLSFLARVKLTRIPPLLNGSAWSQQDRPRHGVEVQLARQRLRPAAPAEDVDPIRQVRPVLEVFLNRDPVLVEIDADHHKVGGRDIVR